MQLSYQEYDDFLVFNKPFGTRTHRVDTGQFGFVEFVSEKLSQNLFVVHRLDKETSGCIMFAKTKLAASKLSELFEKQQIEKTYLFLTDRVSAQTEFKIDSCIEKQDEFFMNIPNKESNAFTELKFIKQVGANYLWQARPKTGKPHQIRLHAQKAGLSILGDNQHGGSLFFRLALHASEIKFNLDGSSYNICSSSPPIFTTDTPSALEECFYKRHALYKIDELESYRLIHDEVAELRADIYSNCLWIYDYSEKGLLDISKNKIKNFALSKKLNFVIRHMLNRGQGVGGLEKSTLEVSTEQNWTATEEGVKYQMKLDSGFSPGLFLDQRENRIWVKNNSKNKKVLNLFSYTSGFSVCAAQGNASEVTTVDVSKKFLDWSKENFKLNNLKSENFEFFSQDTMLFLKGSIKRSRKWDLIICDPPSFGRSKDNVWKLEQNLPELAKYLHDCLELNGKILFTCNLEKKTRQDIINLFTKNLVQSSYEISRMPMMALDYELTDDLTNLMKGFILVKI